MPQCLKCVATYTVLTNSLKEASDELFYWFADNQMKANPDKCHLLTSSSDKVSICVDNYNIKSSKCEKLLGTKIDNKLNFNTMLMRYVRKQDRN